MSDSEDIKEIVNQSAMWAVTAAMMAFRVTETGP